MSFDEIYKAASEKDAKKLQALVASTCIDEFKTGYYQLSAAAQLAIEGNISSVNFLVNSGANINYVAWGAALGGHRDYAEVLLTRGADINYVARGAAQCGMLNSEEETFNFLLYFKDDKIRKKLI